MPNLQQIQPIAIELWESIKPFCSKAKIAGSIRRQKAECKDIELVILPTDKSARNKIGMFFLNNATVLQGKFSGRYVKAKYKGYKVDLFIPQAHDYYRQLAIRTGSSEYSKKIATRWVKMGYMGTKRGLIQNCMQLESNPELVQPISWDSEKDFFKWLDMPWIEPVNRK